MWLPSYQKDGNKLKTILPSKTTLTIHLIRLKTIKQLNLKNKIDLEIQNFELDYFKILKIFILCKIDELNFK